MEPFSLWAAQTLLAHSYSYFHCTVQLNWLCFQETAHCTSVRTGFWEQLLGFWDRSIISCCFNNSIFLAYRNIYFFLFFLSCPWESVNWSTKTFLYWRYIAVLPVQYGSKVVVLAKERCTRDGGLLVSVNMAQWFLHKVGYEEQIGKAPLYSGFDLWATGNCHGPKNCIMRPTANPG